MSRLGSSSRSSNQPELPRLAVGDKVVGILLKDLELVKKSRGSKRIEKAEYLINYIAHELRKSKSSDHLLQTTSIWVLINLFRLEPEETRPLMLSSGVPGALLDMLRGQQITGVSRQYASELCFFLSSTHQPFPGVQHGDSMQPLSQYPDALVGNNREALMDDFSASAGHNSDLLPFVPYRINEQNMHKLTTLFAKSKADPKFIPSRFHDPLANVVGGTEGDDTVSTTSTLSCDEFTADGFSSYRILADEMVFRGGKNNKNKNAKSLSKPSSMAAKIRKITKQNELMSSTTPSVSLWSFQDDHSESRIEFSNIKSNTFGGGGGMGHQGRSHTAGSMSGWAAAAAVPMLDSVKSNVNQDETGGSVGGNSSTDSRHRIYRELLSGERQLQLRNSAQDTPSSSPSPAKKSTKRNYLSPQKRFGGFQNNKTASMEESKRNESTQLQDQYLKIDPLSLRDVASERANAKDTSKLINQVPLTEFDPEQPNAPLTFMNNVLAVGDDNEDDMCEDVFDDQQVEILENGDFKSQQRKNLEKQFAESNAQISPTKQHHRIDAEKLIDHSFTKRLFNGKATVAETQDFVSRLETMLTMLDKESTGFVTWECFARTILALAPAKLLRKDVIEFMENQTDDNEDLIDYNEFVITGKVLVVQKFSKEAALPVSAWLERQRLYAGETSTHSWQNHVKWYKQRKSEALVWLIRRASKAISKCQFLTNAEKFLKLQGKRSKAFAFLLETGWCAVQAENARTDARRALMLRTLKAKRWASVVEEARRYLYFSAAGYRELAEQQGTEEIIIPPKKRQADYATVYRSYYMKRLALQWLKTRASRALVHWNCRVDALEACLDTGAKAIRQSQVIANTAISLVRTAERAREFCSKKDSTWVSLLRLGKKAFEFGINREEATAWLLSRGTSSLNFAKSKFDVRKSLCEKGQFILAHLNKREECFARLSMRRERAIKIIEKQKVCFQYLCQLPQAMMRAGDLHIETQKWLAEKGQRALQHRIKQIKAFRRLEYVAGRATLIKRRIAMAFLDLQQIGQFAKLSLFESTWVTKGTNRDRFSSEKARLATSDAKQLAQRESMPTVERWKTELLDGFAWLVKMAPLPERESGFTGDSLVSRYGFIRLMRNGALLQVPPEYIIEQFRNLSVDGSGVVSFEDIWHWFLPLAKRKHAKMLTKNPKGKGLVIRMSEIVPASDRALVTLMNRFRDGGKLKFENEEDLDPGKEIHDKVSDIPSFGSSSRLLSQSSSRKFKSSNSFRGSSRGFNSGSSKGFNTGASSSNFVLEQSGESGEESDGRSKKFYESGDDSDGRPRNFHESDTD